MTTGEGRWAQGWAQGSGLPIVISENGTSYHLHCRQHSPLATRPQIRQYVVRVNELVSLLIQIIVINKDRNLNIYSEVLVEKAV